VGPPIKSRRAGRWVGRRRRRRRRRDGGFHGPAVELRPANGSDGFGPSHERPPASSERAASCVAPAARVTAPRAFPGAARGDERSSFQRTFQRTRLGCTAPARRLSNGQRCAARGQRYRSEGRRHRGSCRI
jgi:hypothetical protein